MAITIDQVLKETYDILSDLDEVKECYEEALINMRTYAESGKTDYKNINNPNSLYSQARNFIWQEYYDKFGPKYYERQFDLYNIFFFETNEFAQLDYLFGSEFMLLPHTTNKKNNATHEMIYEQLLEGRHGGGYNKIDKEYHYRKPLNSWKRWGDIAEKTGEITEADIENQIELLYNEREEDEYNETIILLKRLEKKIEVWVRHINELNNK